jgi:hypothetical protein
LHQGKNKQDKQLIPWILSYENSIHNVSLIERSVPTSVFKNEGNEEDGSR